MSVSAALASVVAILFSFPAGNSRPAGDLPLLTQDSQTQSALELAGRARELASSSPDSSAVLFGEALRLARGAADSSTVAQILKYRGNVHYFAGDYERAQTDYLRGFAAAESVQDASNQAGLLNELGTLYKRQGDLESSRDYYQRALDLSIAAGDSLEVANSQNNLGIVYDRLGDSTEAMRLYRTSADIKEALGDLNGLSYNLDNMGIVSSRLGDFAAAERFFGRAASIREELGDRRGYGIILNNQGEMYLAQGRAAAARGQFEEALAIAIETSFSDFERHILGQIALTFEEQSDFRSALGMYRRQVALNDSLYSADRSRQLLELREAFEAERREKTIAVQDARLAEQEAAIVRNSLLLGLAILLVGLLVLLLLWQRARHQLRVRLAQTTASIQSQEEERERIAQDLHDGVGQLIATARVNLTSPKPDQHTGVLLDEMHSELRRVAFNLMPRALSEGDTGDALRELARRVTAAGGPKVSVSISNLRPLEPSVQFALYRIAQEWISNVLRHGRALTIHVQLVGHPDQVILTIEDDGPGFDPAELSRGSGYGWKNIQTRAQVVGGTAEVDSRSDRKGSILIATARAELAGVAA